MRLRIATFNLESLGDQLGQGPPMSNRVAALRPILTHLVADVLCLQEVNAQGSGAARSLAALDALLADTPYQAFARATTTDAAGHVRDIHNVVTLSRFPIIAARQVLQDFIAPPDYRSVTAHPRLPDAQPLAWDRPFLHTQLDVGGRRLDVLNLHLRAPLPSFIAGQKQGAFRWASVGGWAEGFFAASIKRNGQALEARLLVEQLFDAHPDARIVVAGDFNSGEREVPVALLRADVEDTGNPQLAGRTLKSVAERVPEVARFSVRHDGRPLLLDHILVSSSLWGSVQMVELLNRDLADEVVDAERGVAGSFHAPLMAEFEL